MDQNIVSSYSAAEAVDDGFLVPVFQNRWNELTIGHPIYATRSIFNNISLAGIMEIWNEYVLKAKTQEQKELFVTKMNFKPVWVCQDGSEAITIMYPEDY